MKNSYQIQIGRIDNGYLVVAQSDDGQRRKFAANDEKSLQTQLKDVIDHMFDAPEKKTKDA